MKKALAISALIFSVQILIAQISPVKPEQRTIDSLKQALSATTNDTLRLVLTNQLRHNYFLLNTNFDGAIRHGLIYKEGEGHLSINIEQENSTLICTITDDGIGRRKAAQLKERSDKRKSMGMKITESRLAMMQKMN